MHRRAPALRPACRLRYRAPGEKAVVTRQAVHLRAAYKGDQTEQSLDADSRCWNVLCTTPVAGMFYAQPFLFPSLPFPM